MQYVKLFQRCSENSSLHKFAGLQIWLQRLTLQTTFMQCIFASKLMFAKYAQYARKSIAKANINKLCQLLYTANKNDGRRIFFHR